MNKVEPQNWSTFDGLTEEKKKKVILETQRKIREEADKICSRRRSQAVQIEAEIKELENKKKQLESFIMNVREAIVAEKDSVKRTQIETLCSELSNLLNKYVNSLTALEKRFRNQKIRILSFGSRSQGKSSFTKAYTNLPDEVVSIKGDGVTKDWTGATSIIIHQEGIDASTPDIYVIFKKPQSIVDTVNSCFSRLGLQHHYSSWDDLYQVLKKEKEEGKGKKPPFYNDEKEKLFDEIVSLGSSNEIDFSSVKRTLENIFKSESDFSDIATMKEEFFDEKRGKKISVEELPQYNNMQNSGCQKYMAVSEIRILADLKHGGMFENMEVCDTKGTSVAAGGDIYEKELYSIIGSSDAVFSIQMTGNAAAGESDEAFYIRLKKAGKEYGDYLKDLKLRHFAIINLFDKSEKNCYNDVFKVLQENNIANTAYAGVLKEGAIYDGKAYHIQEFVDYVIHDMMKKIVVSTNQTDENLLKACKSAISQIEQTKKNLLTQLLAYAEMSPLNEDDIIRNHIEEWLKDVGRPNTMLAIEKFAAKEKLSLLLKSNNPSMANNNYQVSQIVDDDDDDEVSLPNGNSNVDNVVVEENIDYPQINLSDDDLKNGLYEILTGVSKLPQELRNQNETEIIKSAVLFLYNKIKPNIGKDRSGKTVVYGNKQDIGAYIDSAAVLLYSAVMENVNRKYAPSRDIPGAQIFKEDLFEIIWSNLKLDVLYSKLIGDLLSETNAIKQLENWRVAYEHEQKMGDSSPLLPPPSFDILKNYFELTKRLSEKDLVSFKSIIDENSLIAALQKAYAGYDFATRCRQKQHKEVKMKSEVCQQLYYDLQDANFCDNMIELYKYICPSNFVHKLTEAGIIDGSLEEECENQKRILELKNQHKFLSEFSI